MVGGLRTLTDTKASASLVSARGDRSEREADRLADLALRPSPGPSVLEAPRGASASAGPLEPLLASARAAGSSAIPQHARGPLERGFGMDFARVRVHATDRAAAAADALGARAFTHGRDVFFAAGQYAPERPAQRRLLAHELAHTVSARLGDAPIQRQAAGDEPKPAGDPRQSSPAAASGPRGRFCPRRSPASSSLPMLLNLSNLGEGGAGSSFVAHPARRVPRRRPPRADRPGARVGTDGHPPQARPGTPPQRLGDPGVLQTVRLINPVLGFQQTTGAMFGSATLSGRHGIPVGTQGPDGHRRRHPVHPAGGSGASWATARCTPTSS